MKRLTKDQLTRQTELAETLRTQGEEIKTAIDAFNTTLANVIELRDEIVNAATDYRDARSEKWQESDAGSNYNEWLSAWEELPTDDLDVPDVDSTVDALEALDSAPAEA